jgi:hypothetical protein
MQDLEYNDKEEEFLIQYEQRLIDFVESGEQTLHVEPMNSYYRRLMHNLALRFNLKSHSEGADRDRHVVVIKSENARVPDRIPRKDPVIWNYGDREFLVDPLAKEVEIYLGKDGTVGILSDGIKDVITSRKVVSGAFKIKRNRIVEVHDDEW